MEETQGAVTETGNGSEAAPVADAAAETVQAAAQTPDVDSALEVLEKNWESIPQEKRARLDRHYQPAFNRRVNWLNNAVETAVRSTGIDIPEGKTPLDLLTEDNGRGFAEYIGKVMETKVAPLTENLQKAEFNQNVNTAKAMAIQDMPDIAPFLDEAVSIIESTPDLLRLAMSDGGKGFYRAYQGVGAVLALQKMKQTAEAAKIAQKTADGTTRAGQSAPKDVTKSSLKGMPYNDALRAAVRMAAEKVKAEAGT